MPAWAAAPARARWQAPPPPRRRCRCRWGRGRPGQVPRALPQPHLCPLLGCAPAGGATPASASRSKPGSCPQTLQRDRAAGKRARPDCQAGAHVWERRVRGARRQRRTRQQVVAANVGVRLQLLTLQPPQRLGRRHGAPCAAHLQVGQGRESEAVRQWGGRHQEQQRRRLAAAVAEAAACCSGRSPAMSRSPCRHVARACAQAARLGPLSWLNRWYRAPASSSTGCGVDIVHWRNRRTGQWALAGEFGSGAPRHKGSRWRSRRPITADRPPMNNCSKPCRIK